MSDIALDSVTNGPHRGSSSRLAKVLSMALFGAAYACLTLFGSLDFLLNDVGVVRLNFAAKAPISREGVGASVGSYGLPDNWLDTDTNAASDTRAWRYTFVFELDVPPSVDQEVYLPRAGDDVQITVNGRAQPAFGELGTLPNYHWSMPLLFPVSASAFLAGRNELIVDVYANERRLGSLFSVSVGPRGAFDAHHGAIIGTTRGMAYVLMGLNIFAIFALSLYAASVSGEFFILSIGICASVLGCLLPQLVDGPSTLRLGTVFTVTLTSFVVLISCGLKLCAISFPIERKRQLIIHFINIVCILSLWLSLHFSSSYDEMIAFFVFPSGLIYLAGLLTMAIVVRRYLQMGDAAAAILLLIFFFMLALGTRDLLVLFGWVAAYQGFYSMHGVAVLGCGLCGLILLRIQQASEERAGYEAQIEQSLAATRLAISKTENALEARSLDALVSRIATTYSHEFRNPLAAASATTNLLLFDRWEASAKVALNRIQRSVGKVSDALDQQFDFQRAMQSHSHELQKNRLPHWLQFSALYQSCKIVWLSDPLSVPEDTHGSVYQWLHPHLEKFENIPSVCLVHAQKGKVVLHLYLHLNASNLLRGHLVGDSLLSHLKPERLRNTEDGQYLYWQHAYS